MSWTFDLLSLAQSDTTLKKVGHYYIGPCPFCGGKDRFTVKALRSKDLWICRQCGTGKYQDAIDYLMKRNGWGFARTFRYVSNLSDDVLPDRQQRIVLEERKRKQVLDRKLSEFTTEEIWEALHRRMAREECHREWWRKNGVPDEWQDYLRLGWTPEKTYISVSDGDTHVCPAYTIPYFMSGKKFRTMQYRMCGDNISPADRYRFEYGLGTSFYMTTPTLPFRDKLIVCEGAKKAIVTKLYTSNDEFTVLGVPSKSDFGGIDAVTDNFDSIWIVLDPDANDRSAILAEKIGPKKSKIVELPMKIDDAFIYGGLTPSHFRDMLRQGVKV